ncbi:hypothetical protein DdX_21205 [Ditylenchus destructor]|uniref:Uncharacterized protein n=1 Tax=Ditylenchus destructor TaxID=166010 RepID=A0AAD4MF68_9BILA|nr:hypothetical protein DdX_21205 [Ditylenchus destructor]
MEQKVPGHPQLQKIFGADLADASKFMKTLNSSLKMLEQRIIGEEKNTSKGILISLKGKLSEVITTLGDIKNEANPNDDLQSYADSALEYAGQLSVGLDAALKVEEKNIDIRDLREKAAELTSMILVNIAFYAKSAKKTKVLQKRAYRYNEEFENTLDTLQVKLGIMQKVQEMQKTCNKPLITILSSSNEHLIRCM